MAEDGSAALAPRLTGNVVPPLLLPPVSGRVVSCGLQPAGYGQEPFREAWERIGHGGV